MMIKKSLKTLITFLLLGIFLIPTLGVVLYVHECNSSNHVHYNVESGEVCCSHKDHHSQAPQSGDNLLKDYSTKFIPEPCCQDSQVFIKLGETITSQIKNLLDNDLPLISTLWSLYYSELNSHYLISFIDQNSALSHDAVFLKLSCLRL